MSDWTVRTVMPWSLVSSEGTREGEAGKVEAATSIETEKKEPIAGTTAGVFKTIIAAAAVPPLILSSVTVTAAAILPATTTTTALSAAITTATEAVTAVAETATVTALISAASGLREGGVHNYVRDAASPGMSQPAVLLAPKHIFHDNVPPGQQANCMPFSRYYASSFEGGTPSLPTEPTPASPEKHDPFAPPDTKRTSAEDWAEDAYYAHQGVVSTFCVNAGRSNISSSF